MSDLTVLIPTFNRPSKIIRSTKYWVKSGYKISVLDGSDEFNQEIASIRQIRYFHWKNKSIVERWRDGILSVDTSYFVICADDDFIGFDALERGLSFLKDNKDYSCAHGRYCAFTKNSHGLRAWFRYPRIETFELNSPKTEDRLHSFFRYYAQTIYSVQKSNQIKQLISKIPSNFPPNAFEFQFNIFNALVGKQKIFDDLYGVREDLPNSGGKIEPSVDDWIANSPSDFVKWQKFNNEICQLFESNVGPHLDLKRLVGLFKECLAEGEAVLQATAYRPSLIDQVVGPFKTIAKNILNKIGVRFKRKSWIYEGPNSLSMLWEDRPFSKADALRINLAIMNEQ